MPQIKKTPKANAPKGTKKPQQKSSKKPAMKAAVASGRIGRPLPGNPRPPKKPARLAAPASGRIDGPLPGNPTGGRLNSPLTARAVFGRSVEVLLAGTPQLMKTAGKIAALASGRMGQPLAARARALQLGGVTGMRAADRFVILPPRGTQAEFNTAPKMHRFLTTLNTAVGGGQIGNALGAAAGLVEKAASLFPASLRVLDSIRENGAKLVQLSDEKVSQLRAAQPGMRIVPVVYYRPALAPLPALLRKASAMAGVKPAAAKKITITLVTEGNPALVVPRAQVLAFTDFEANEGAQGTTDDNGVVSFTFATAQVTVERLYVFNEHTWWDTRLNNVKLKSGVKIPIEPINLAVPDALEHFCGRGDMTDGEGVTVGVLDTGCGPHNDLVVAGGENTVTDEAAADFGTSGHPHGTHVAGIIAGRGTGPTGLRGVAPGVKLMSYRVFGKDSAGAENFAIAKAIDRAVEQGCDLLNLSLGGGDPDDLIESAIADARAQGVVAIIAAGNDGRQPVSFPGSDARAIAVSALGRKGTFPKTAAAMDEIAPPPGTDSKNFIAAFSNVGPEIDVTGPGVAIVSTVFKDKYAAFNGTSMACPAVCGVAARLLAASPTILNLPRNQARSDAIVGLVLQAAKSLGFTAQLEGQGLPV